jgi:hypothetical protein
MVFGLRFHSPFKGERNHNSTPSTVKETTSDEDPPSSQPTDLSKRGRTSSFLLSSLFVRKKRKPGTPAKKLTTPVNQFPSISPLVRKNSRGSALKGNIADWSISKRLGPDCDACCESIEVMGVEEMAELIDVVEGSPTEDDGMRDASKSLADLSIDEL